MNEPRYSITAHLYYDDFNAVQKLRAQGHTIAGIVRAGVEAINKGTHTVSTTRHQVIKAAIKESPVETS